MLQRRQRPVACVEAFARYTPAVAAGAREQRIPGAIQVGTFAAGDAARAVCEHHLDRLILHVARCVRIAPQIDRLEVHELALRAPHRVDAGSGRGAHQGNHLAGARGSAVLKDAWRSLPEMPINAVMRRLCGNCGRRAAIFATVDRLAGCGYPMVWA